MSQIDDEFKRLVGVAFTAEEQERFDQPDCAFTTERLIPGREELLRDFDGLLEVLLGVKQEEEARRHKDRFLGDIALKVNISFGTELRVSKASSFVTQVATGELAWGVLNGGADIFGDFAGLSIAPWYDVPTDEHPEEEDLYFRDCGLMIAVTNPHLVFADGERQPLDGRSLVPLNHGMPEMYRVLRPTL